MSAIVRAAVLLLLAAAALTGCRGTSQVGCPAGQHAVPASGGFTCEKY